MFVCPQNPVVASGSGAMDGCHFPVVIAYRISLRVQRPVHCRTGDRVLCGGRHLFRGLEHPVVAAVGLRYGIHSFGPLVSGSVFGADAVADRIGGVSYVYSNHFATIAVL